MSGNESRARGGALAILIGADPATLEAVRARLSAPVALAALDVDDWNAALSPWPAPGLRPDQPFAGSASDTLARIAAQLPAWREQAGAELGGAPARTLLAGYSLAGLCALWAAAQVDWFQGVGSISGSLWYDGFDEYLAAHPPRVRAVYLSLGSAEPRARSKRLARVGECTLRARELLAQRGLDVAFEWNPGNHFVDAPGRMARGIDWLYAHAGPQG